MSNYKGYGPPDASKNPRYAGIRSFMRLPQVTDLSDVDIAIVGVPFDTGGTYKVGARFGPAGIRNESMIIRPNNLTQGIGVFEYCSVVDYGDLESTPGYLADSHEQITVGARKVLESDAIPIFMGGDHSISYPLLRAVAEKHGPVALVHFDSHTDLYPYYFDDKATHGTPFRQALEDGLIDTGRSSQVGLRGSGYGDDIDYSREMGFQAITGPELHDMGMKECIRRVRERVGSGPAYMTFDIDFVDPVFAPGTGTPEVGGFNSAESLELVRGMTGIDFVGYDLVEVMPGYDPASMTQLLAANLIFEMMSLTALRKREAS